jgi:hypothetical protein
VYIVGTLLKLGKLGKRAFEKTQDAALEMKARIRNCGGNFEPIPTTPDDDTTSNDDESTDDSSNDSPNDSPNIGTSYEQELRNVRKRTHELTRLRKQTDRAQHRANIREKYGLASNDMDTAFVIGARIMLNDSNGTSARNTNNGQQTFNNFRGWFGR